MELVELAERLLVKQLDKRSASTYETALKDRGIRLHLGTGITRVCCGPDGNIASIQLSDGQELPCTMLVVTAGVRPNIGFLEGTGVELDRFGLVIDSHGRTNIPRNFRCGRCDRPLAHMAGCREAGSGGGSQHGRPFHGHGRFLCQ